MVVRRGRIVLVLLCLTLGWDAYAEEGMESGEGVSEQAPAEPAEQTGTEPVAPASPEASKGLLGDVRVGATVGVGLPHPLTYGIDVLYKDLFSGGFTTGRYKADLTDANVELTSWDARLRWHPFHGSFFVGAAYGKQGLAGEASKDLPFKSNGMELTVPTTVRVEFETTYLTPHVGWFAVWDSGFTMGFEIGAQMPLANTSKLEASFEGASPAQEATVKNSKEYKDLQKSVDDVGKLLGKSVLPSLTLIKLGWMF